MTPKFKPGDKVRVIRVREPRGESYIGDVFTIKEWLSHRDQYDTTDPYYLWPEDCLELLTSAVTVEQALKVLTDAGYTVTITQGKQ